MSNLSIVVTARELNPELFVVLRQNLQANQALFDAFESDFTVVPSQIVARECLAILTTPAGSLPVADQATRRILGQYPAGSIDRSLRLASTHRVERMRGRRSVPGTAELAGAERPRNRAGDLLRDPHDRAEELACRVLYLAGRWRFDRDVAASPNRVRSGDQLLFVGQRRGARSNSP